MFDWLFGSNNTDAEIINNMFYYTINNRGTQLFKLLNDNQIDPNDKKYKDYYNNTLLHVLASSSNVNLASELISYGLRRDHKNIFNERAVDIALKNNNLEMVWILTDLINDNKLVDRINGLEIHNKKLYEKIEKTEAELGNTKEEIKTLKRKRCDDSDVIMRENKRLKIDNDGLIKLNDGLKKVNDKLTKDNGDLQTTVNNLRESFKK